MELVDLIPFIEDVGIGVIAMVLLWQVLRSSSGTERALIDVIKDLSANINASTKAITDLKEAEDDTQTLVEGGRRENIAIIGALADESTGLAALAKKLDAVPDLTAGKVRDEVRTVVGEVREKVVTVALQLDRILMQLDSWKPSITSTGTITPVEPEQSAEKQESTEPTEKEAEEENSPC